ncbi:MAG: hypothetical protein WD757_02185 [Actinomycetota bacterium]
MADHKEIRHLRLFVKVPGGDKLRKTAAGRLRYLLNAGWREMERVQETDYIAVRLERTGHRPPMTNIPKAPPPQQRGRRDFGRGGPRDQQRGGPRQPPQGAPAPAPASAPPAAPKPATGDAPAAPQAAPAKPAS